MYRTIAGAYLAALIALPVCVYGQGSPVQHGDVAEIQSRLERAGLSRARAVLGPDGRVQLLGEYESRAEVQVAFSLAQQLVGVKWVAPTTPENIRYPVDNAAEKIREKFQQMQRANRPQTPAQSSTSPPAMYGLVVGVGRFANLPQQAWLKYTAKDANDFYQFLVSARGGAFPKENVRLLIDERATRQNIEMAMDEIARKARPGDKVVVYFSSHGTPLNDRANMGIITYDTEVQPRHRIFHTSLTDERLSRFVQSLDGARTLIILDTCYSGKAYEKVPGFLAEGAKDLFYDDDVNLVQGIPTTSLREIGGKGAAAGDGRPSGGGKMLISASDADQRSWESASLKNSFFTYHLVQGLLDRRNVRDAYDQAKPAVMRDVKAEKNQVQTPQAVFLPAETNMSL